MSDDADADARALLAAAVPANVRSVCATLTAAGHQAVTVGGAVRDALLGRAPGDWDVATSARPEHVLALFRHTIPTGLQHGTVTIITGKGIESHVEVTTFRGEGAYSDARRPDHVVFGVPLVDDLARRDLVVNAIAYDPANDQLIDPFGGRADLAAKRLRAVGDPVERFTEDGLRVMRAVRFAAKLEFTLDPATEAGIAAALPSLAKVSRERVSDELRKLLAAREPSRGLVVAVRTGIIATIVPELAIADAVAWAARIDRATPATRLAALFAPLARAELDDVSVRHVDRAVVAHVAAIAKALKFSNAEADAAAVVVGVAHAPRWPPWNPAEARRLLAELDAKLRPSAIDFWASDATSPSSALVPEARRVLAAREPLAIADLAIGGKDILDEVHAPPGRVVGQILALLLVRVLDDPAQNTRELLLAAARQLALELGTVSTKTT
jgi:tRNA nucleotidyltransferase (CCA-adding enzyme)